MNIAFHFPGCSGSAGRSGQSTACVSEAVCSHPPTRLSGIARTRCCSRYLLEGCEDWARAAGAVRSLVSGRPVCALVRQNQGTVAASEGMCPCQCVSANPEHPFPWPLAGFQNVSVLSALYPGGECPARGSHSFWPSRSAVPSRTCSGGGSPGPRVAGGWRCGVPAWPCTREPHRRLIGSRASRRERGVLHEDAC